MIEKMTHLLNERMGKEKIGMKSYEKFRTDKT